MSEEEKLIEQPESTTAPEEKVKKPSKLALCCALLALFLIILMSVGGFYFYKQHQTLQQAQQQQLDSLSKQFEGQSSQYSQQVNQTIKAKNLLEAQIAQASKKLQQVANDNKIVKTDIKSLQRSFAESKVRHPNEWILAEVEYLLALSGRKIWLEQDIETATSLLSSADQRIVALNDASLSPLRSAILEDINTLQALPKLDTDGVILALTSLERRVDQLRSASLLVPESEKADSAEPSGDIKDWDINLKKSWDAFIASFITVNKRDSRVEALLSPEQSWYLKENIRINLAKAEFAVYREQQDVYDIALTNMQMLLNDYYDLDDNATSHFYKSVLRLSKRKITINYPDQLKSAPLLERILDQRLKTSFVNSELK